MTWPEPLASMKLNLSRSSFIWLKSILTAQQSGLASHTAPLFIHLPPSPPPPLSLNTTVRSSLSYCSSLHSPPPPPPPPSLSLNTTVRSSLSYCSSLHSPPPPPLSLSTQQSGLASHTAPLFIHLPPSPPSLSLNTTVRSSLSYCSSLHSPPPLPPLPLSQHNSQV